MIKYKHPTPISGYIQFAQKGDKIGEYRRVNPEDYVIDPNTGNRKNKYTGQEVTFIPEGFDEEGVVVTAKDPRSVYQKRQDYPYRSSFDGSLDNTREVLNAMTAGYSDIPFQMYDAVRNFGNSVQNGTISKAAAVALPLSKNVASKAAVGTLALTPLAWAWNNGGRQSVQDVLINVSNRIKNGVQNTYDTLFPNHRVMAEESADASKADSSSTDTVAVTQNTTSTSASPQPNPNDSTNNNNTQKKGIKRFFKKQKQSTNNQPNPEQKNKFTTKSWNWMKAHPKTSIGAALLLAYPTREHVVKPVANYAAPAVGNVTSYVVTGKAPFNIPFVAKDSTDLIYNGGIGKIKSDTIKHIPTSKLQQNRNSAPNDTIGLNTMQETQGNSNEVKLVIPDGVDIY